MMFMRVFRIGENQEREFSFDCTGLYLCFLAFLRFLAASLMRVAAIPPIAMPGSMNENIIPK